jgi:2-dehydropantoate 2-reductase
MQGSWGAGLQALRAHGVRVAEPGGGRRAYPVQVLDASTTCPPVELALVLVKAWQTQAAADRLAGCLAPGGVALTLQNGLGNYEILENVLGADRSALGVTTTGASLEAPGLVRLGGEGSLTLVDHPRLARLAGSLRLAGFDLEVIPGPAAASLLWGKLVINTAINPLTALLEVPNGALLEIPEARCLLAGAALEAASVAAAQGIPLPFADPVAAVEAVAQRTAANRSSMLQDLERGAPTEIDAICGAVVLSGERCNVPTPVNRVLWDLVKAKANKRKEA